MKNKNFLIAGAGILLAVAAFSSQPIYAQREDYKVRELNASPQIKQVLAAQRKRIEMRSLKFKVGYTYALERGIKNVTGGKKPNVSADAARKQNTLAERILQLEREAFGKAGRPFAPAVCSVSRKTWDWRRQNKVTPVRTQRCGNCWAYAGLAAYESSYLIQNNKTVDGSEQFVVSNNKRGGSCDGGSTDSQTMPLLVERGTTSETVLPDSGTNGTPDSDLATPYDAVIWGWANPDNPGVENVEKIQQAICEYGAVATFIDAGGTFGSYVGGDARSGDVYNDDDDKEPGYNPNNHFVSIIGWDDDRRAWLIKNSWGQGWGFEAGFGTERGYGWVAYNTHQVGTYVSWVRAKTDGILLPTEYYKLLPYKRRQVIPIPPVIIKKPAKVNKSRE